jgi:hypothetical protein
MILAVRRLHQQCTSELLGKRQALGAIVAEEDTEWHFLMMIPRSSAVTVQYN